MANNNKVIVAERFNGLKSWDYIHRERKTHHGNNMIFNCDCCFDADVMPNKLNIAVHASCKKLNKNNTANTHATAAECIRLFFYLKSLFAQCLAILSPSRQQSPLLERKDGNGLRRV
jgi:hypothetical protein